MERLVGHVGEIGVCEVLWGIVRRVPSSVHVLEDLIKTFSDAQASQGLRRFFVRSIPEKLNHLVDAIEPVCLFGELLTEVFCEAKSQRCPLEYRAASPLLLAYVF